MPIGFRGPGAAMAVVLPALVASTTGVGIAATQIDGRDLKDRSIATPTLRIGSVRAAQLGTGAGVRGLRAHLLIPPAGRPCGRPRRASGGCLLTSPRAEDRGSAHGRLPLGRPQTTRVRLRLPRG